jgi:putative PEP-CTERM system histidine kinase
MADANLGVLITGTGRDLINEFRKVGDAAESSGKKAHSGWDKAKTGIKVAGDVITCQTASFFGTPEITITLGDASVSIAVSHIMFAPGPTTLPLDAKVAAQARAWLAVPLIHFGNLIGFVVLAESRAPFKLEREAFDLLRVVGREVASRIAEQRAAQILDQTRQLREYSQRFAFVIHDIKNVSGQLSMLLSNAEVHADNPEFQRDMLVTVRASVGKITRLLDRLRADRQERSHTLVAPAQHVKNVVETCRINRAARIDVRDDGREAGIAMDPEAFDAVLTHLLNNAVEATGNGVVTVDLRRENLSVAIDIVDQGPGMTPEFVRDTLFRPFSTTKGEGHGIGAFQARELLRDAGGDLLVLTRLGQGTTMRILLPTVPTGVIAPAALEGG